MTLQLLICTFNDGILRIPDLLLPLNLLVGGCVFYDPGRNSRINWSIDVQKETKHYLTNLDVIGAFNVCDQLDSWEFKG